MDQVPPPAILPSEDELAPPGGPPHVAVAPELVGFAGTVLRDEDDTDADYAASQRLLAAALRVAALG